MPARALRHGGAKAQERPHPCGFRAVAHYAVPGFGDRRFPLYPRSRESKEASMIGSKSKGIRSASPAILALFMVFHGTSASAQDRSDNALRKLNESVDALIKKVSPSVVQILVTGYGRIDSGERSNTTVDIGRHRAIRSGFVIDPAGYIITNAHVVTGAQRVQVVVPEGVSDGSLQAILSARTNIVPARVVGVARDIDVALLKVDNVKLAALPLAPYRNIHQGEVVLAFGSPEGLRNTVTFGVVSSVARQIDPDSPLVYVQTDAPINPGNSGGPLVNVAGELVGINTFILSQSGGNQGLGFAIPSAVVTAAYPMIRKYGQLQRDDIGVSVQGVTPALASGLGLPREWGVMVADVVEGGPAQRAGIRIQDIITSVDRKPTTSVPLLSMQLNTHRDPDRVVLGVLRGSEEFSVRVGVVHVNTDLTRLSDTLHLELKPIDTLGILSVEIDDVVALLLPSLRIPSGLIVAARTEHWGGPALSIAAGMSFMRSTGWS